MVRQPKPRPWHGRRNDPFYYGRSGADSAVDEDGDPIITDVSLWQELFGPQTPQELKVRRAVEWSAAGWLVVGVGAAICLVLAILGGG